MPTKDPQKEQWINVKGAPKGLNTFDDPTDIDALETPDNQNIIYGQNMIAPRPGSKTFAAKPTGETGSPLQLITAQTSDGIEYLMPVYDNHFYVWHDQNEEFVRINTSYVPDETTRYYGNVNWNNGRGDDRMYACNGVDNFIKWHMAVSVTSGAQLSTATTLTLVDSTRFPTSGSVVIKGNSGEFVVPFTANSGNVLTITGTLGQDIPDGASVMMEAEQMSGMEIGKVVGKHGSRLFVMNYYGGETTGWYSVLNDPEDFTTGSNVSDASTFVIADGNGEITSFNDFGDYAVIEKGDSFHSFSIVVSNDLGSKLDKITPILSGDSIGPISQPATLKLLGNLIYPTSTEGFIMSTPQASGNTTSINLNVKSFKIQNSVRSYTFDKCRGVLFDQKCLWSVGLPGGNKNLVVLFYDSLRDAWGRIYNWAVCDWGRKDNNLYYLDNSTGDIIQCFTNNYHDNNQPYQVYHFTKQYNFDVIAKPKTNDLVYIEGLLTPSSEFFVDILDNENGTLSKQTYRINKDTPNLALSNPLTDALGEFLPGQYMSGGVILGEIGDLSVFRCYLSTSNRSGFFNTQLKFYSNKTSFWAVNAYAFRPELEAPVPSGMVISPIVNS